MPQQTSGLVDMDIYQWATRERRSLRGRLGTAAALVSVAASALALWSSAPEWLRVVVHDHHSALAATGIFLFLVLFVVRTGKATCLVPLGATPRDVRTRMAARQFLRAWSRMWWAYAAMYAFMALVAWGVLPMTTETKTAGTMLGWMPQWFMVECYAVLRWETVDRVGPRLRDPLIAWRVVLLIIASIEVLGLVLPSDSAFCTCSPHFEAVSVLTGVLTICLFASRISTFAFALPEWVPITLFLYAGTQLLAGLDGPFRAEQGAYTVILVYGILAKFVLFWAVLFAIESGRLAFYLRRISLFVLGQAAARRRSIETFGDMPALPDR